jgi:aspartate-semialdehyde dehydrogenase
VGVLGATGAVGQRFLQYLEGHPWFEVTSLGASERSAGKKYEDATSWQLTANLPDFVRGKTVSACSPTAMPNVDFVFSALVRERVVGSSLVGASSGRRTGRSAISRRCGDVVGLPAPLSNVPRRVYPVPPLRAQDANVAGEVEAAFRDAGIPVFSNARNYRMVADVPLVVPPVNGDHLDMVKSQPSYAANGGFIVTNANCSTTGMVIALKPLADAFGIEAAHVTTLQAISGAGYPGLPSLDILDNVVPYISGEEDKLETEYQKIMGVLTKGGKTIDPAVFPLSAMVNRVHVRDGHSIAISLKLVKPATPEQVADVLRKWKPTEAALAGLPSAPKTFIEVRACARRRCCWGQVLLE